MCKSISVCIYFLYTSVFKEWFGEGKSFASKLFSPGCSLFPQAQCICPGLCPGTLPILEQAEAEEKTDFVLFWVFLFCFNYY